MIESKEDPGSLRARTQNRKSLEEVRKLKQSLPAWAERTFTEAYRRWMKEKRKV